MKSRQLASDSVTCAQVDTEYTFSLPVGTKFFTVFTTDDSADIRISYAAGTVATPTGAYTPVANGEAYWEADLDLGQSQTVYVASDTASAVVVFNYGV